MTNRRDNTLTFPTLNIPKKSPSLISASLLVLPCLSRSLSATCCSSTRDSS